MNGLSPILMVSAAAVLLLIVAIGIASGRRVRDAVDFDTGGKRSGSFLVAGAITGTLVGGSSTIGTAQMAFHFGLSAWWFTLGAAVGCLLLGLWLQKPLRRGEHVTIQGIIRQEYGEGAGVVTSVLTAVGVLLNIVAQILSANALLGTIFGLSPAWCGGMAVVIMACYVLFGGIRGAGMLGIVKLALLYAGTAACGLWAVRMAGGLGAICQALPRERYFNLFARGPGVDLGAGLSACLGILSTQAYIQAVLSAKTDASAKKGAILSVVLTPPIGLFSILVGCYMRLHFPHMDAAQAFPQFVLRYLPPAFAGMVLAALLIAVVGTGGGMALGFGTIFTNDIYKRFVNRAADGHRQLAASRAAILAALVLSLVFTCGHLGSAILDWGFLSMGLRAVVLFIPMCAALYFPGRFRGTHIMVASSLGLLGMVLCSLLPLPLDSLLPGLAVCAAVMLAGRKGSGMIR